MTPRKPTIVDIARKLNISSASVSRALRGIGKVGPELREKIVAEARRIGYTPNPSARAFRQQKTNTIGLIVPTFFSAQIETLVSNIQNYVQQHDYGVLFGMTEWDTQREINLLEFMVAKRVEGIIIKSRGDAESLEKMCNTAQQGIKVVSLLDKVNFPNIQSVVVDNVRGGYLAARHLLERGHDNILYVTSTEALTTVGHAAHFSRERQIGMLQAYQETGRQRADGLVLYLKRPLDMSENTELIRQTFSSRPEISAIFAYDDEIAAKVSQIAREKCGKRIPSDLSIVGFDDSDLVTEWSNPPITVIRQPDEAVAFEAANLVIGTSEQSEAKRDGNTYILEPELIERSSTGQRNR